MNSTSTSTGSDAVMSCGNCGASIYREHIDRGLAGRWAGQVLCPHCLAEKRGPMPGEVEATKADSAESGHPGRSSTYAGFSVTDFDSLVYKRSLLPAGHGASRMRIFHCKLSEGPLMQLNRQVNDWLDAHSDIEVRFATSVIGTWEGRHAEQHIILTLYY